MPKTKIICTIGPSSSSPEIIRELILNGMDVARLNFSHGTHGEHREKIRMIRNISEELSKPVAILQDLCGPKIRVGKVCAPGIRLEPGQSFILTNEPIECSQERVFISYRELPLEVRTDDRILLADGMMELLVKHATRSEIHCEVITGGILTSHKGINLPTGSIRADALTEKDRDDLLFGLSHDADYVALSFVRTAQDVLKLRDIIKAAKKDTPVIAKIEKHEALNNIEEIMKVSDGIMVARGDLGVEIPPENVPGIQKMLVRKANEMGKPVIIATQMLRSMVNAVRPTRAEATDVANAVLDGADAIMLSEETASGNFPVQSLSFMVRIAGKAEENFPHDKYLRMTPKKEIAASVAHASCTLADHLGAAAIVATSRSGFTATQISRFRPKTRIIAVSPEQTTIRRLALYWGCYPHFISETRNTDERIEKAAAAAVETGDVSKGDLIVITTGHPVYAAGTTNMVRVKQV
jgi:pyruvate kinase